MKVNILRKSWILLAILFLSAGCAPGVPGEEAQAQPTAAARTQAPDYPSLLESAVTRLTDAQSYAVLAVSIRAYTSAQGGEERTIYGEFIDDIRYTSDPLRVEDRNTYRFGPKDAFISDTIYSYQEGGAYYQKTLGDQSATTQVDREFIFPYSCDALTAVERYYASAVFIEETGGTARYSLAIADWYTMKSAAMFADMGMLYMQEDAEAQIEAYAREHYPHVAPIALTVDVDTESGYIQTITVDDAAFMLSVWDAVADEAIGLGADPQDQTRYAVRPENGARYEFSQWNEVGDIAIPE